MTTGRGLWPQLCENSNSGNSFMLNPGAPAFCLKHQISVSSSTLDDVSFDFSIPGSPSQYHQEPESSVAKSRDSGLIFVDGVWSDFGLEVLLRAPAEMLGKGTFGSAYATKLDNGMTVAVKRLKLFGVTEEDFKRSMEAVGNVRHPNVAALRAYCTSIEEKLVLYDHHSRGSVSDLLHGKPGLYRVRVDWETRLRIAIGAARGISHIHAQNGGMMVHGNIKSSNIFINSECYGYVSDLGLANMITPRFLPSSRCYAPEVKITQNVSQASDVYSFGILLLELLTRKSFAESSIGRVAVDLVKLVNSVNSKEWNITVFDRELMLNSTTREHIVRMLKIGLLCVENSPKKRPSMSAVVKMIEDIPMTSTGNQNFMHNVSSETERNKLVFFGFGYHTFDQDDMLRAFAKVLGKGTFGTSCKVILENKNVVSVKKLRDLNVTYKKVQQHLEDIGRMVHQNVAELRAYYYSKDHKLLVYDYYAQGSLSTMLHGTRGSGKIHLDWKTRLEIALGTARGIAHIHTRNGGKLVHGNVITSNIFLNEQQCAVVSDVRLANLMNPIRSLMSDTGDFAPEVIDSRNVSQASDVYSFGVVLFELVSGKSPRRTIYHEEDISLRKWIISVLCKEWTTKVIDSELLRYGSFEEGMVLVLQLGMDCIAIDLKSRPKMADVVKRLEEISGGMTIP